MVNVEVFVAAFSALAVIFAGAFYWILSEFRTVKQDIQTVRNQNLEDNGKLRDEFREENRALRDELRQEIRDNTQRILDAIYFHRHDPDGTVALRPPTQQAAD